MPKERSKISTIFVRFRANFGQFRADFEGVKISGVFGQNFVPDTFKISVGFLSHFFWNCKTALCEDYNFLLNLGSAWQNLFNDMEHVTIACFNVLLAIRIWKKFYFFWNCKTALCGDYNFFLNLGLAYQDLSNDMQHAMVACQEACFSPDRHTKLHEFVDLYNDELRLATILAMISNAW